MEVDVVMTLLNISDISTVAPTWQQCLILETSMFPGFLCGCPVLLPEW